MELSSTYTSVSSGHTLCTNTCIESTSASMFGPVLSRTLTCPSVCYLTGWLVYDIVIFWQQFYRPAWRSTPSCEALICGLNTTELRHSVGSGWTRHILLWESVIWSFDNLRHLTVTFVSKTVKVSLTLLRTNLYLRELQTQFVPCSKHTPSR
jgi:hypothetical protein